MPSVINIKGIDDTVDIVANKMTDAEIHGATIEFDPHEADRLGAFTEDALSEQDALESGIDLENIV